jgi:hypothetical protein
LLCLIGQFKVLFTLNGIMSMPFVKGAHYLFLGLTLSSTLPSFIIVVLEGGDILFFGHS